MRYFTKRDKFDIISQMAAMGYDEERQEECVYFLNELNKLLKINVFALATFIHKEKDYDNEDKLKKHIFHLFEKTYPSNKKRGMYYQVYLSVIAKTVYNRNQVKVTL
jgi:hypothetical protein